MSWTTLVPLKPAIARKSRLAAHLSAAERIALSERMADHVVAVLRQAGLTAHILRAIEAGDTLNQELHDVRLKLGAKPLLVIHADLPFLTVDDVGELTRTARAAGAAIAPDRGDRGTNALALWDAGDVGFAFGADSFARHRAALPHAAIVRRAGLATDIDTPADHRDLLAALPRYRPAENG